MKQYDVNFYSTSLLYVWYQGNGLVRPLSPEGWKWSSQGWGRWVLSNGSRVTSSSDNSVWSFIMSVYHYCQIGLYTYIKLYARGTRTRLTLTKEGIAQGWKVKGQRIKGERVKGERIKFVQCVQYVQSVQCVQCAQCVQRVWCAWCVQWVQFRGPDVLSLDKGCQMMPSHLTLKLRNISRLEELRRTAS